MGRVRATIALAGALWLLPAASLGHPGHVVEVRVQDFAFQPAEVTIDENETVIWRWTGVDRNHSVTSDGGQAESFDSDPGKSPAEVNHAAGNDYFSHGFARPGRFTYYCKVHPQSMRGVVNVTATPVSSDRDPPLLARVSVRPRRACSRRGRGCRSARAELRYTIYETAVVSILIERRGRGRWRLMRSLQSASGPGARRRRLPVRGLPAGRYRVRLSAEDGGGNRSRTVTTGFTVRRPPGRSR
jgi:plastocyanin